MPLAIGVSAQLQPATELAVMCQQRTAAIVRKNCIEMMDQVGFAALSGIGDEAYKKVIEEAMNEFMELFKNWVATFQKDDYEDEWGLFK